MADGSQNGTVPVKTKNIKEIERGGTRNFKKLLGQSYGANWPFQKGTNLKGDFNVTSYYPCQPLTPCGGDLAGKYPGVTFPIPGGRKGGIGATLSVDYERSRQDEPNPNIINDPFWIQRAIVNTGGQPITVYGQTKTYFDLIDTPNPLSPFYRGGGPSGKSNPQTEDLT